MYGYDLCNVNLAFTLGFMVYTLGQAAKAAHKSKAAVAKAIATNKLSATKDAFGRWQIDPAELERVYPNREPGTNGAQVAEKLRATVEGLERLCQEIRSERDNLRDRLAQADEERSGTLRQLTALLTDQRDSTEPRRQWWPFGKRRA
jgi:hypothetical protein